MVSHATLVRQLGSPHVSRIGDSFGRFASTPPGQLACLASMALDENWGTDHVALYHYLAAQVRWSIEQERYSCDGDKLFVSAGNLQTRYGTPLYLILRPNARPPAQARHTPPWAITDVVDQVFGISPPSAPDVPTPPLLEAGREIVLQRDHILGDNAERVAFLRDTPPVAQMCAVAGAVQWSLFRELAVPYWYFGRMNYLVPLYLSTREDITQSPDVIAPVEVLEGCLLVRTVLLPHYPYSRARIAVKRHDQLPRWLVDAWTQHAQSVPHEVVEDPEPVEDPQSPRQDGTDCT
jgi:hypothetical protein